MKTPYDYSGFVGDGIADDTLPLQAAFNDAGWLDMSGVSVVKTTATLNVTKLKKITGLKTTFNFVQAAAGAATPCIKFTTGSEGSEISGVKINYNWGTGITAAVTGVFEVSADSISIKNFEIFGNLATVPSASVRVCGILLSANYTSIEKGLITYVSGYGIYGNDVNNITVKDVSVTRIGDGYGIAILNSTNKTNTIKILGCTVDLSYEPATSIKNAIIVGQMTTTYFTRDVLVDGCTVKANSSPDNTTCGSITLGNTVLGRVSNCSITGGGIGISIAYGYANTVTGNTIDMQGGYNASQGRIGYGIEIAGSQIACMGNAIEGHATLQKGVAIQCAVSIYNVNVGPNNIQACITPIYQQPGHPGPFRILNP